MPNENLGIDPFAPNQIAHRVETIGIKKATMPARQAFVLAILAGAFIAFGGMYYTTTMTGLGDAPFGPMRMLGGIAFSLGLVLVIVAGAELFTGNNLITMAWANGHVSGRQLFLNGLVVYSGNLVGSVGMVLLAYLSGYLMGDQWQVGATALKIANAKVNQGFLNAFASGILCNILVCLAVWMCFAARSITAKILIILFPISAFVALGFEHCVANMYLIPIGIIASFDPLIVDAAGMRGVDLSHLGLGGFLGNLLPVTLGNVIGGAGFVALVYYFIYLRGEGKGIGGEH
jgi:formate/nitrite transporter